MNLQELLRLQRDAPTFIRTYELRQRCITAQLLLADTKRNVDAESCTILYTWVENNSSWLRKNQEHYNRCQKLVRFTAEQLTELYTNSES